MMTAGCSTAYSKLYIKIGEMQPPQQAESNNACASGIFMGIHGVESSPSCSLRG